MSDKAAAFRSRILGSWRLISYTAAAIDNPTDIIYPLGQNCVGRAMYSHDGYISAHIQSSNVKPYSSGRYAAHKDELADAAGKTLSYTGAFRLEADESDPETKATVYYDVEVALPTTWVGTTEVRALRLERGDDGEDYLYLGPPGAVDMNGTQRIVEVKTVRARDMSSRL